MMFFSEIYKISSGIRLTKDIPKPPFRFKDNWKKQNIHLSFVCFLYLDKYRCLFHFVLCIAITVKTLYNVTRYNRTFNIRHEIARNGFVSIKIPSL